MPTTSRTIPTVEQVRQRIKAHAKTESQDLIDLIIRALDASLSPDGAKISIPSGGYIPETMVIVRYELQKSGWKLEIQPDQNEKRTQLIISPR